MELRVNRTTSSSFFFFFFLFSCFQKLISVVHMVLGASWGTHSHETPRTDCNMQITGWVAQGSVAKPRIQQLSS